MQPTMKMLRNITPLFLYILLSCCTFQVTDKGQEKDYTSADLIGRWEQTSTDNTLKENGHLIEWIQLLNDSIAEVQVRDASGVRKVPGKWQQRPKQQVNKKNKIFAIFIEFDLHLTYLLDHNHSYTLLLGLKEVNGELRMKANNNLFVKRQSTTYDL